MASLWAVLALAMRIRVRRSSCGPVTFAFLLCFSQREDPANPDGALNTALRMLAGAHAGAL